MVNGELAVFKAQESLLFSEIVMMANEAIETYLEPFFITYKLSLFQRNLLDACMPETKVNFNQMIWPLESK